MGRLACGVTVVYRRPCRSKPRTFTAKDVGRIAGKACAAGVPPDDIRAAVSDAISVCELADDVPCFAIDAARSLADFYRDAWNRVPADGAPAMKDGFGFRLAEGAVGTWAVVADWYNTAKPKGAPALPSDLPLANVVRYFRAVIDGDVSKQWEAVQRASGCATTGGGF